MQNSLNAPISYSREKNGYYYSGPYNFPLSTVPHSDIETLALLKKLLMCFDSDDSVYKKASDLISKMYPATDIVDFMDRIVIAKRPTPIFDKNTCDNIILALHENRLLDFDYKSKWEPDVLHRHVMPYQLVIDEGQFYLFASKAEDAAATRLYNISRIHNLTVSRTTFELPEKFHFVEDFEKGRWGAFQYDETYEYKIEFSKAAWHYLKERKWADDQKLERFGDDKIIMTFTSSQWIPIEHWLLSFGADARPVSPDWFVQNWEESVQKMHDIMKREKNK